MISKRKSIFFITFYVRTIQRAGGYKTFELMSWSSNRDDFKVWCGYWVVDDAAIICFAQAAARSSSASLSGPFVPLTKNPSGAMTI